MIDTLPFSGSGFSPSEQAAYWIAVGDTLNALESHGYSIDELWQFVNQDRREKTDD